MKPLIRSLSILALGGILAGMAYAGPGDAYVGYPAVSFAKANAEKKGQYATLGIFRTGVKTTGEKEKAKAKKTLIPSGNPKMPGVVEVAK